MNRPRAGRLPTLALSGLALVVLVAPAAAQSTPSSQSKLDQAMDMTGIALALFELDMPPVVVVDNDANAYALNDTVYIGDQLVASLSSETLAQILLHEAGHIAEQHGHQDSVTGYLHAIGVLPTNVYQEMVRNGEREADAYAAFGAWLFDPNPEWPGIADWFMSAPHDESPTHPDSAERALSVSLIATVLDTMPASLLQAALDLPDVSASGDATSAAEEGIFWDVSELDEGQLADSSDDDGDFWADGDDSGYSDGGDGDDGGGDGGE